MTIRKAITGYNPTTNMEDTDLIEVVNNVATTPVSRKMTWEQVKLNIGMDYKHGIETIGAITFDNTSHIVTIASGTNTYWYKSRKYTTADAITCDLDETADRDHASAVLTANTLYQIYFKDATGKLYWSPTGWSLEEHVPVCHVFWNGTAGAVSNEKHCERRDIDWHINAHMTIGARIIPTDFAMSTPSVASPATVNFAGGTLYDEDLQTVHLQQTNCRIWYQTSASKFTFVDSNSIYPTAVSFVNSAGSYALTAVDASKFINMWVYASPDLARGIYAFVETKATGGYNTAALARAVLPPSYSGLGIQPEIKLLYRIILKGDGTFVEFTDYRASTPLPGGSVGAPTAAGVSFSPSGNVASTSVQGAIEELDTEKIANPGTPEQGDILYWTGSAWARLPHGDAGQVLTSGGHGANPSWTTL